MKRRILLPAFLAVMFAVGGLFASDSSASAASFSSDMPVAITCTSTGQACNNSYQTTVTTSFQLTLAFQSAWDGCAGFSVAFFVDGQQVFASPVLAPFVSTGTFDAGPVTAGGHTLEVRATGVAGGCNTGTLTSWAGRFAVTTNDDPPPTPEPDPEPDPGPEPGPEPGPTSPASIEDCRDGGWRNFTDPVFKNRADCVKFVEVKQLCERLERHKPRHLPAFCKAEKPPKPEKPGKPDKPERPGKPGKDTGRG